MARLLYIKASPRGERSFSIRAADAFVAAYRDAHPDDQVEELDLFSADLAEFDAAAAEGKYAVIYGKEGSEESRRAWKKVEETVEHFKSFDKYVLAVPMWNFGMPYRLKLYFDTIIQPTLTFAVTEGGYKGLVEGKKAMVAYSSGGEYGGKLASLDHRTPHVEGLLGFMGIEDRSQVNVAGTLGQAGENRLAAAIGEAREMAKSW
ncbi:MAG: FMN-dependent NADH-azoreductase [Planctomycetota bacterium]|jgi:FMN-dependent NADH-azoreductase